MSLDLIDLVRLISSFIPVKLYNAVDKKELNIDSVSVKELKRVFENAVLREVVLKCILENLPIAQAVLKKILIPIPFLGHHEDDIILVYETDPPKYVFSRVRGL